MEDFKAIHVFGSTLNEFSISLTAAIQSVPQEVSARLREIRRIYIVRGFEVMYSQMNDRTVGQILTEAEDIQTPPHPIRSGKVDGVAFSLYEAPNSNKPNETESS